MINFYNLRYHKVKSESNDVLLGDLMTIEEINHKYRTSIIEFDRKIVVPSLTENFKITDKGGKRLIDFIRVLSEFMNEIDIYYDPGKVSYLLETCPNKLISYSSINPKMIFNDLSNPNIMSFKYNGVLLPTKFKNKEDLFHWVVVRDPELGLTMMNETRNVLINDKYLLKKDLKFFSDQIPSASLIHQKYGFEVGEIIESFGKYLSINFK